MPQDEAPLNQFLDPELEQKQRALAEPGPGWGEWFLYQGAKPWMGLLFLILDVWVVGSWLMPLNAVGLGLSLVAAIYLEFLAYRYLWYVPSDERARQPFHPSWRALREVGIWTPEEKEIRAGHLIVRTPQGPDPREFL